MSLRSKQLHHELWSIVSDDKGKASPRVKPARPGPWILQVSVTFQVLLQGAVSRLQLPEKASVALVVQTEGMLVGWLSADVRLCSLWQGIEELQQLQRRGL